MKWSLAVSIVFVSCMADYGGQRVTKKGIHECKSPVVDRIFYLDTNAPDFKLMATWPLASSDGAEIQFTDLKTGERITLKEDSLNYKCEYIGEMPGDERKDPDLP